MHISSLVDTNVLIGRDLHAADLTLAFTMDSGPSLASLPSMSSTDAFCNLDLLRSEKRSFSGYLRYVVTRLENDLGLKNPEASELLKIESPDLFLDSLMSPKFFLYVHCTFFVL